MDCAGNIRAGMVGQTGYSFATDVDKTLRSHDMAFVAPGKRRTIRRKAQGVQFKIVPLDLAAMQKLKQQAV